MSQTPPPPPPQDPASQGPPAQQPPPPPVGQPSYGQPSYGQPAQGQPIYGQQQYGAPAPGGVPGAGRPGELLDRFLARLIDGILLAVVNAVIVTAIVVGTVMGESGGYGFGTGTTFAVSAVSAILTTVIYLGYFAFMEASRGQTVGKMIMKLRTVGPAGGNPTVEQAVRRNIWAGLSILGIVPFLGILGSLAQLVAMIMIAVGINSDPVNRQAWHDKFAGGTQVLKIG